MKQSRLVSTLLVLSAALGLLAPNAACGGGPTTVNPTVPDIRRADDSLMNGGTLAVVEVTMADGVTSEGREVLTEYDVPGAIQRRMTGYGDGPAQYTLRVNIVDFRVGFGPSRMRTTCQLVDTSGAVLREFETTYTAAGGSRFAKVEELTQQTVNQLGRNI